MGTPTAAIASVERRTPQSRCSLRCTAVTAFADAGGNLIDTADVYAVTTCESIIGRWLKSKPGAVRDEVVIASKGKFPTGPGPNDGGPSRRHLSRAVDASLGWLGGGSHRLVPGPRLGSLDTDRRDLAGPRRRCQRGQDPLRRNVGFHGLAGVKSG